MSGSVCANACLSLNLRLLILARSTCLGGGKGGGISTAGQVGRERTRLQTRGEGKVPAHTCTHRALVYSGGALGSQLDDSQAILRAPRSG